MHNRGMLITQSRNTVPSNARRSLWNLLLLLPLVALVGCASTPPPVEALSRSENAVLQADAAGAGQFAAADMRKARRAFESARLAAEVGENLDARRSAEIARAYAELAEAKALAERAALNADRAESNLARWQAELETADGADR